ncbi:BgTH12-05180 [Blumeria graminis f. sp. triticale]|uniref:BgtAc-31033 n=3 Tax=Blumeria graminis TaxID=34373 RepID=A0A9X9QD67_BLUGR|nr:hypothetical protein BGT96224_Ac31033 [Blumeria graminis f. sp. tritici 96224]CAD6502589.1 BgTH12-05180 [Blumeria graminis f. sp. triticale]VDB88006.1 BgtAc-31033 [Blumeria graminis f. sp. tritici]
MESSNNDVSSEADEDSGHNSNVQTVHLVQTSTGHIGERAVVNSTPQTCNQSLIHPKIMANKGQHKCLVCFEKFPSRHKLLSQLRDKYPKAKSAFSKIGISSTNPEYPSISNTDMPV